MIPSISLSLILDKSMAMADCLMFLSFFRLFIYNSDLFRIVFVMLLFVFFFVLFANHRVILRHECTINTIIPTCSLYIQLKVNLCCNCFFGYCSNFHEYYMFYFLHAGNLAKKWIHIASMNKIRLRQEMRDVIYGFDQFSNITVDFYDTHDEW